jgi:hypothetical protein
MALNGHAPPGHNRPNDSASQIKSLKDWLETHGRDDFDAWKHDNPTQHLSYEDWKVSNHVYGPYLYYATLQVWSESDPSVCQRIATCALELFFDDSRMTMPRQLM